MAKKPKDSPEQVEDSIEREVAAEQISDEEQASRDDEKKGKSKEKASKEEKPPKKATGARGGKKSANPSKVRFIHRSFLLKFFVRIALFFLALSRNLQIEKVRTQGLKPPFIILCNHQSFTDYAVVERAVHPCDVNHICEVSEFVDSESLMNSLGCIPLRRFVADNKLFYHLRETLLQKKVAAIYPEAHLSFDGSDSPLPEMLYKMLHTLKVPVVVVKVRGTYISHPCWSSIDHKTQLEAVVTQIFSHSEIQTADEATIKARVQAAFHYDDLWWQLQNNVSIPSSHRAEGLENIFYLCPVCKLEYTMASKGTTVFCTNCKQEWTLTETLNLSIVEDSADTQMLENMRSHLLAIAQESADKNLLQAANEEYAAACRQHKIRRAEYERAVEEHKQAVHEAALLPGTLTVLPEEPIDPGIMPAFEAPALVPISLPPAEPPPDISRINHWIDFQRENLLDELDAATYQLHIPVQVELLEDISHGFVPLGAGTLEHTVSGFVLSYRNPKTGQRATLTQGPLANYSCHVDFDYNGKGAFIDLSTTSQTFYLYPDTDQCSVTKIALATEEIYRLAQAIAQEKEKA